MDQGDCGVDFGVNSFRRAVPWWLWPNVLSLDAPLVAVAWQRYFTHVSWGASVALFCAVWVVYITDRLLDARRSPTVVSTFRHAFYKEHGFAAGLMLAFAGATGAVAAELWVPESTLVAGLGIALLAGAYLWLLPERLAVFKHFVAAPIFALGVFVMHPPSVLQFAAFACLCLGNMLLVEGRGHRAVARISFVISVASGQWPVVASAVLLLVVDLLDLSAESRSVLADLALLTPLI